MRPKLLLIVLLLVIVPTAILSLMAGRSLSLQELVLQRRMETAAVNAVNAVSDRVKASLDGDLDRVCAAMADCLARGGKISDIAVAETSLKKSSGAIKRIYLFMNPWGFMYPGMQSGTVTRQSATSNPQPGADELVSMLQRRIASGATHGEALRFTVGGASYCFGPLRNEAGLYAGYEIDGRKFEQGLARVVKGVAAEGIVLVAEGQGLIIAEPTHLAEGQVTVGDSLSRGPEERISAVVLAGEESVRSTPLTVSALPCPYDRVQITAFLRKTTEEGPRPALTQARLYAWGVLLLAGVIILGTWTVIREAAVESRLARARSDFVIGVSHDLRTPLAAMKVLAETLYLDHVSDGAKRKEFLGAIVRESGRLSQLVERVLFFVRFGQDTLAYRFRESDVGMLVSSAVEVFRSRFTGTTAPDIRVEIKPGLPKGRIDESAMTQVVLNLLDNAWKYGQKPEGRGQKAEDGGQRTEVRGQKSDKGNVQHSTLNTQHSSEDADTLQLAPSTLNSSTEHRTLNTQASQLSLPTITVSVRLVRLRKGWIGRDREWIRLEIRDYGIGMEKKELRKIFQRFYRVPGSQEENISGVGLGLALCRHVVRAHGGRVEVESSPGVGSTFSVLLPV
jgi:signal transduction histidine kinase